MFEWLKAFLRGMASINLFPVPLPSYTERFGTDEELIQQDYERAADLLMQQEEFLTLAQDLLDAEDRLQNGKSHEREEPNEECPTASE